MQRNPIPLLPRPLTVSEHRRIVTADLGAAHALGRRAVEVLEDQRRDRVDAVVDADGQHVHKEGVLVRRAQAQLCGAAEEQRPDVHRGACGVGWDELGVQRDGQVHASREVRLRHGGNADEGRAVLHALRVLVGPEDLDFFVRGRSEGFEPFVALLAVVEARGHAVDAEIGVFDELGGAPLAGADGVGGGDVAIHCEVVSGCE